jgi:hypothetical protein
MSNQKQNKRIILVLLFTSLFVINVFLAFKYVQLSINLSYANKEIKDLREWKMDIESNGVEVLFRNNVKMESEK